jgi:hypothetical protein
MAIVPPNPTQGAALYADYSGLLTHDDFCDSKSGGVYSHKTSEFSATECEMILDLIRTIVDECKLKAENLSELADVDLTGLNDGDTIIWDLGAGKWIPALNDTTDEKVKMYVGSASAQYLSALIDDITIKVQLTGEVLEVGSDSLMDDHINSAAAIAWSKISKVGAVPGDVGAAAAVHNHAGADINSGEVGVAYGGTGGNSAAEAQVNLQFQTVSPHTSSPVVLTVGDTFKFYTNQGTTTEIEFQLPTAAAGLVYYFACLDTDGLKIRANTGDDIRIGASASSTAGYASSTTIGSTVMLVAIDATTWLAFSAVGTWGVA